MSMVFGAGSGSQYIAWQLPRKVKVGEKIKVSGRIKLLTQRPNTSNYFSISTFLLETTSAGYGDSRQGVANSVSGQTETINTEHTVATYDAEYFSLKVDITADTGAKSFLVEELNLSVSGETLALENYVFDGEILDASANGNHATVSGSIEGDNDAAVEALYQKISARISNNS